jgi:hypothetical protein
MAEIGILRVSYVILPNFKHLINKKQKLRG